MALLKGFLSTSVWYSLLALDDEANVCFWHGCRHLWGIEHNSV